MKKISAAVRSYNAYGYKYFMDSPAFRRVLALRNSACRRRVLLAGLRDCPLGAHLAACFAGAAERAGLALDLLHSDERDYGLDYGSAGFRIKYSGMDNLKDLAALAAYTDIILVDLPYKDELLPAWLWLALRAGGKKHFIANDNLMQRGHFFAMDMAEDLKVFNAFDTATVVDQHPFSRWSRFGRPRRFLARPLAVDCSYYSPAPACTRGYVLSFGRADRDYAPLVEAAGLLPAGLRLRICTGLPVAVPARLRDRVSVEPEPAGGQAMRALLAGSAAVALPVGPNAGNPGAGLTAALLAMSSGRAPVACSTPAVRRCLRDGEDAFLYRRPEPRCLAAAINRALGAGPAAGRRARSAAVARFDLNAFAAGFLRRLAAGE